MARHCIEPGTDKLEGVGVRCDKLRNLLPCEICIISKTKNRHTQVSLEQRSSDTEEDVFGCPGWLTSRMRQPGRFVVRLEPNVAVDGGAVWRVTRGDLVVRDMNPLVLYKHIAPRRREGGRGASEESGSKDGGRQEPVVAHN